MSDHDSQQPGQTDLTAADLLRKQAEVRARVAAERSATAMAGGNTLETIRVDLPHVPTEGRIVGVDCICHQCGNGFESQVIVLHSTGGTFRRAKTPELCEDCMEAKREAERLEQARRRKAERRDPNNPAYIKRLVASGIQDERLWTATLGNYVDSDCPEGLAAAKRFVTALVNGARPSPPWLFLSGPTGTGKTHLLVGIDRALWASEYPGEVVLDVAPYAVKRIQQGYGTNTADAMIEKRVRAAVWLCDDLGRGKQTDDRVQLVTEIACLRAGLPTVLTSNYTRAGLEKRHEEYMTLVSRLGPAACESPRMVGRDRRDDTPQPSALERPA